MNSCKWLRRLGLGVCALWLATSSALPTLAQDEASPLLPYRGLRPMALGNAYEAIADDLNAIDYNPAGLANIDQLTLRIVPMQLRFTDDFVEATSEFGDILDELNRMSQADEEGILSSNATDLLVERIKDLRRENLRFKISGANGQIALPLPSVGGFRVVGAASVANQVFAGIQVRQTGLAWGNEILDVLDDSFILQGSIEVLTLQFAAAVEKETPTLPYVKKIRAGINWRVVTRNYLDQRFRLIDMLDPKGFAEDQLDLRVEDGDVDSFDDVRQVLDNNTEKRTGTGLDFGIQLDHTDYLTTAYVVRSLVSSFGDVGFPTTHNLSVAARPLRFLKIDNALFDILVAGGISTGSYDDAQSEYLNDSITDNIHLGAEFTLFPRSPVNFSARVGNNQGYPTVGIEAHLAVITAGVVYYGDLEEDWWTGGLSFDF